MGCLKGKPVVHIQSTKAIPKPNTKATQKGMCLKPRAVREGGKKNCMFQCRNMRVADCATVWDCKCLQLMHLSALHLTLFDICSTIYIINCFNQTSLSWRCDYLPGDWIFVDVMICKRASQVMGFGFGSSGGQTSWPCSKHESQRQNKQLKR